MRRLIEDGIVQIHCVDLGAPDTGSLPSILSRRQFPVFSAFAMTINNDQGQNYASHKPLSSHTSLFSWSIACCIIARLLSFRYEDFHSPTAPLTTHNFALCVPHAMSFLQKFRSSVILIPTQHKLIIHSVHLSIEFNYFYDINTTIWREAKEEC